MLLRDPDVSEDIEPDDSAYERAEPPPGEAGPREQFPRSSAVADLARRGLQDLGFEALLDEACTITAKTLDVDFCHVFKLRPSRRDLLLRAGVNWPEDHVGSVTMDLDPGSQNGYTVTSWQPTVVTDIREEDRFEPSSLMEKMGIVSGVTVVIPAPQDPWGTFGAHSREPRAFDELDTTFVQSMGQVLSAAVSKRRIEDEKARYETRLKRFAYTASHDLQEPLRMVTMYLNLIEQRYDDLLDEEGKELFSYATEGAQRMRKMVNSLLQLAEITTQEKTLEAVDANAVFEQALANLDVHIQETNAEITTEDLPTVKADPDQLSQVFQNLLSNAIKYSGDAPPRVHVKADRAGGFWQFAIHDEGIGIEPQHIDKIFTLFYRLDRAKGTEEGTGTGLALCEQIVDQHGGRMWVESEPEEGSTFFFTMPAATPLTS